MSDDGSGIRQRLVVARTEPPEVVRLLDHLLNEVGNPALMTAGLKDTLVAHATGNPRTLAVMADNLLAAAEQDREVLDEERFFTALGEQAQPEKARQCQASRPEPWATSSCGSANSSGQACLPPYPAA